MTSTDTVGAAIEHAIGARGELILRTHTGQIAIRATDGDMARIRDLDGRRLEDRFAVERTDGRLTIRPRDNLVFDIGLGRRGKHRARLAVEVPRKATVSLDTTSADVQAVGLAGEQRYRTASGAVELTEAEGTIGLDAVSGDVRIAARGELELSGRLVSGDLRVAGGALRTAAIGTTSGDIEVRTPLVGPGPYSIQTVSGDASLAAGPAGLQVEAQTVTGRIDADDVRQSESAPGRRRVVAGSTGPTLSFRSISGDLRITRDAASGEADARVAPQPPRPPEPPRPPSVVADEPAASLGDDARLAILRDVEAGTIDVATATELLAAMEDASDA